MSRAFRISKPAVESRDGVLESALIDLRAELSLEAAFFERMLQDDDWAFLVKVHAFLENTVTRAVHLALKQTGLGELGLELPLTGSAGSRIAVAQRLGLLQRQEMQYIQQVLALREGLALSGRCFHFQFAAHVQTLPHAEQWKFVSSMIAHVYSAEEEVLHSLLPAVLSDPKRAMWTATAVFLSRLLKRGRTVRLGAPSVVAAEAVDTRV